MEFNAYSDESGSLSNISIPISTPTLKLDGWRGVPDTGTTSTSSLRFTDHNKYGIITNMDATGSAMGLKSASAYQFQTGSNPRRTSDSELDHTKPLMPSPGHQSMMNLETDSILKSSYNMAANPQESFKSATRIEPAQRKAFATPDLEGRRWTKHLDDNNNLRQDSGNLQGYAESQRRKKQLDLRPIQRNSLYPLWKFSKSREPPEAALDIAYRTILDYKQPVTLHRQPKADRQMVHYDFLPSIKVFTEEDQHRREAMRFNLKQQLQLEEEQKHQEILEEEQKHQEILEMDRDIVLDGDWEENVQKNIFLPSGKEYEFSEGDLSTATLPVPSMRGDQRNFTSSHHSSRSTHKPSSPRPVSSRHSSQDVIRASNASLTISAYPPSPSPSPSANGSKRRHSVSTRIRREKMISVVSHWPGMQPNPKLFEIQEPPNDVLEEEDTIQEEPKPPHVRHHHRRRHSRMPSHTESKNVQRRALSLAKGL